MNLRGHSKVLQTILEYLYPFTRSPDLNPVEEASAKLKYMLKYKYQEIIFNNLEYALLMTVENITPANYFCLI